MACGLACLARRRLEALSLGALAAAGLAVDLLVLAIWLDIDSQAYVKLAGIAFVVTLFGLVVLGLTLACEPRGSLARTCISERSAPRFSAPSSRPVLVIDADAEGTVVATAPVPVPFGTRACCDPSQRPSSLLAALWFSALAASRVERPAGVQTLKRMLRTSPSSTTYVLPSSRCRPRRAASACDPALEEVVPANHLAADEAARDVGVNRVRRLERRLTVAERPGARLLVPDGEERDQAERLLQRRTTTSSSAEGPSRNAAASSSGSSASSASSVQSMPPGPFSSGISGFVVSGSSSCGSSPGHSESGWPVSRWASSARSAPPPALRAGHPTSPPFATRSRRRSTCSRSATSSSRRSVSRSLPDRRPSENPSSDGEQGVRLSQLAGNLGPCRARRRRGSPPASPSATPTSAASCSSRSSAIDGHPDVRLLRDGRVRRDLRARLRQRVEERRLPGVGKADDADLECHERRLVGEADPRLARVALHVEDAVEDDGDRPVLARRAPATRDAPAPRLRSRASALSEATSAAQDLAAGEPDLDPNEVVSHWRPPP